MAVYYMKKCFSKIKTKPHYENQSILFYRIPNQGVYAQLGSVLIFFQMICKINDEKVGLFIYTNEEQKESRTDLIQIHLFKPKRKSKKSVVRL